MIDFHNAEYLKLRLVKNDAYLALIEPLLVDDEKIAMTFQSIRDGVVFTNKRIVAVNVQGVTGKKKDITCLPYSKIQAFSIESAGVFDIDSELVLWFSGMGQVKFEFTTKADINELCRMISLYVLK